MRTWFVWPEDDFPRSSTQKPRTNAVLQAVQAQLGATPGGQTGLSSLAELIARVKGKPDGEVGQKSDLETDLNLSSLDRVELLGALEDRYQVDLSETRFAAVKTVGDLERMLDRQGSVACALSLSDMGAALAHDLGAADHSLSPVASRGVFAGMAAHHRARKSAWASRSRAGRV